MKNTTRIACFVLALTVFAPVHAAEGEWYGSLFAGAIQPSNPELTIPGNNLGETPVAATQVNIEFDTGYGVDGAVGYDFGVIRTELELSWGRGEPDKFTASGGITDSGELDGSSTEFAGIVNAWLDIDTGSRLTPFIGGGIGSSRVETDIPGVSDLPMQGTDSETSVVWQVGAGLGFRLNDSTTIQARYKYRDSDEEDLEDADSGGTDIFSIGLLFRF